MSFLAVDGSHFRAIPYMAVETPGQRGSVGPRKGRPGVLATMPQQYAAQQRPARSCEERSLEGYSCRMARLVRYLIDDTCRGARGLPRDLGNRPRYFPVGISRDPPRVPSGRVARYKFLHRVSISLPRQSCYCHGRNLSYFNAMCRCCDKL